MQFKGCREVSRLPMGLVRNWDIRTDAFFSLIS
nr:MAG TPA_asm: hypothetical protein [Caudoviricetes sp.]